MNFNFQFFRRHPMLRRKTIARPLHPQPSVCVGESRPDNSTPFLPSLFSLLRPCGGLTHETLSILTAQRSSVWYFLKIQLLSVVRHTPTVCKRVDEPRLRIYGTRPVPQLTAATLSTPGRHQVPRRSLVRTCRVNTCKIEHS